MLSHTEKWKALRELAEKRRQTRWPGFENPPRDFDDYVSPYTKGASNVDSPIFVMLQDWGSTDAFADGISDKTRSVGYTPSAATNRNLEARLQEHFELEIRDVYATNLFPFIKQGSISARIPWNRLVEAAEQFAVKQIEIVEPRLVIALGLHCYQALRSVIKNSAGPGKLRIAIADPFEYGTGKIYCQAHTGWGVAKRGREQTARDWEVMATWFAAAEPIHRGGGPRLSLASVPPLGHGSE